MNVPSAPLAKRNRMAAVSSTGSWRAAFDRITWIPTTMPASPLAPDLYTLLAVAPMFIWDVFRNRSVHSAYVVWLALNIPFAIAVHGLWDTAWWHEMAPRIMGVG